MKTLLRSVAALEMLLVFPAVLFMVALFARNVQPQQYEPAHSAQRIVDWYASSPHVGLWILLMGLPLVVVVIGCISLVRFWRADSALRQAAYQTIAALRTHLAAFLVACATASAFAILAVVALHVLTD